MFDNSEKSFDSSLSGLGNSSTYLDKDPLNPNPTDPGLQQLPSLNVPADYAGNTLATARAVGTLTGAQSFNDWVGSADTNDYYKFNVGTQSNFSLSLTGLSADANIELLNSSGGVISRSTVVGNTSESITSQLSAGTYYARVYQYSGDTNYSLSLNATAVDNAGNTLATARNIGTLTGTQSFNDWVGSADTNDYYSFNVERQSNFSLSLTGLSADADVQLLNSSGTVISSSTAGGTTSESITRQLSAGTYYVQVYPYSGNTTYSLSLTATAVAPVDNAGNTLDTARTVGTLTATQSFSDWVGKSDTNDYYEFNVERQSNFSLSLTGLSADADVQLLNSSGTVISSSTAGGTTSESITCKLSAGTYYVRVYQYSGNTNYTLSLTDWYSQNLRDAQIITLTSSLAADGNLSRNDMIAIFRDAKDGGVIDASELTDLRTLVSNSTFFTMADSVKVLSNKIANSDVANTRSGIGNLFAGSSATQMENLIGKWFLGNDRPDLTSSSYTYSYVSGSLFQNGLSADDIYQGAVGDCYYLVTLASIAEEKPDYIQNMFTDNGDNTFTVRFYNNGVADYVTVDRYLPTSGGYAAYAGWGGGSVSSSSNELWVALAEKAYAQLAESGWSRTYSDTQNNSYAAIESGWMDTVVRQVTGLGTSSFEAVNMTQTQLINLVNSHQVLTVAFVYGGDYGVVNGHAYTITSYNATNGTFHLQNPWGFSHADVTWNQIVSLRGIIQWSNT
ncbi:pre-peptidase C-terminal domain-containing protein [Dolichospermum planctonicum CS-1226]|uniref:Pre-peptidase C-terminal domain-containing protein n=1 Tax=Dolichospermum planctonicum CS-1226 TaxID=3021751 RepID=A0ABT5ADJ5_9CYAN|nr:pre-peptidase C-terminal domain-containing protein [Dolichospermum planctonicum]MDB9535037.1 pre-peptidase C-terminal domain-containing protein [Dolichospermum planctonicum CS-1226]